MFTIDTAITTPDNTSSAGFVLSSTPDNYAPSVVLSNNHPVDTIVPTTPITIVDGVIVVPAPSNVRIRTLTIDRLTYVYTLTSPPPAGYFTVSNGQISIGYRGLTPPLAIGYYLAPVNIDTNYLPPPYPNICSAFPLSGKLTWTLNWEEQPSATFEFITDAAQKSNVEAYFDNTRNIEIYGVNFCPSGQIQIVEISLTKSAIPLIKVTVNLTGFNAHLLDKYVSLGIQTTLPDCTAPPNALGNSPSSMTVQDLASRLGTNIAGTIINIDPSILRSPATPVNLGNLLDSSSIRGVSAFIDYHTTSIKLVPYGSVGSHTIDIEDIRSDISSSTNRKIGINGNYYKTYDPLTKVTYGSNPPPIATPVAAPSWQPVPEVPTTTTDGDPNPEISPYTGAQRDLSIVFDISGKRKRKKVTNLINGQPMREMEEEWGYVAVAKDDVVFTAGANPTIDVINGTWRRIESKQTDYTYNALGYLVEVRSRGTKLSRYRVENAQKPESLSVRLATPTPDPGEVAQLQTFRFFEQPTERVETYTLARLADYYDDIIAPRVNRTICLPDGTQATIPVVDEAYIEPYFVKEKLVSEDTFSSIPDPKSTALKPLPNLTTGKKVQFVERTTVQPRPTLATSIVASPPNPTEYTKSTDNYSAGEGQFSTTLSIAESAIVSGRPPTATNRGAQLVLTTPPTPPTPAPSPAPFAVKTGASNENVGFVTVGSVNFPTARTQAEARLAASVDIDIINSKNTCAESLLVNFRPNIRPGDVVNYASPGGARRRRAISVTNSIDINGRLDDGTPFLTTAGTQLKLGLDVSTPMSIVNIPRQPSTLRL